MGRTLDRFRMANKAKLQAISNYGDVAFYGDDVAIYGDDVEDAQKYAGLLAMAAQAGGEIASGQLKSKAIKEAKTARSKATVDAQAAALEKDPKGPLHQAAEKSEAAAKAAEAKVARFQTPTEAAAATAAATTPTAPTFFTTRNVLIGVGVLVAGFVGYKLLSGGTRGHMLGAR